MLVGILDFAVILVLTTLLIFIVFWQDYYLVVIKSAYDKSIPVVITLLIRFALSIWIYYSTTATILGVLQILVIQLIVLLCLRMLSKYVQNHGENWYITLLAFTVYGIGFYFFIMYAKEFI